MRPTTDVFRRIVAALDQCGIPFMLTGSFASSYHGSPRATQDIDLVIAPDRPQLQRFVELFDSEQYYLSDHEFAFKTRTLFNIIDYASGWKIDLIIKKARAFSDTEFQRREQIDIQGLVLPVATAEDVLISKMEWAKMTPSDRQLEDCVQIVLAREEELDRAYIEKWVSELELTEQWQRVSDLAGTGT